MRSRWWGLIALCLVAFVGAPVREAAATCVITHVFVSTKPDSGDATLIRPSNWNDCHKLSSGTNGNLVMRDTSDATYGSGYTTGMTYDAATSTLTAGGFTASGSCKTKAQLDAITPALGMLQCCSDCTVGTGSGTSCTTTGTVGTMAFVVNAGTPAWRCL